ncbi:MAG: PEGA domain-containing protein, partial [Candidatus Spechtbacterales bacterium]|nr:PEGA domain-containing protein [Candidatus Spechtbacterales bacterium]
MRYKTRKYLFISFTALFFITIAPIVLYTQGYRLDTNTLALKKTGGLDLDVNMTEAKVFLNGELERETNFIFRSAVFRNILPGTYEVRLEKDGYFNWQKTAEVEEGRVTKFPGIRLFPRELTLGIMVKDAKKIFMSDNGNYAIVKVPAEKTESEEEETQNNTPIAESNLILYDLIARQRSSFLDLQRGEEVTAVYWSPESEAFSVVIEGGRRSPVFYTGQSSQDPELTDRTNFLTRSYPQVFDQDNIVLPSNSANLLYVFTKNTDNTYSMNRIDLEQ